MNKTNESIIINNEREHKTDWKGHTSKNGRTVKKSKAKKKTKKKTKQKRKQWK